MLFRCIRHKFHRRLFNHSRCGNAGSQAKMTLYLSQEKVLYAYGEFAHLFYNRSKVALLISPHSLDQPKLYRPSDSMKSHGHPYCCSHQYRSQCRTPNRTVLTPTTPRTGLK